MTKLKTLHAKIVKEQKRIGILKATLSNGDYGFYDFISNEILEAKILIAKLQVDFNLEYDKTL